MDIIVCIKQVPDITEVKTDPKTGALIREGIPCIVNPDDKHAVEEAIRLRENCGGRVVALSMGPPQAKNALTEVYAMGADEAILLSDKAFAGSDTWATAYVLSAAIRKIGHYDIIFCGRQAIDGDTAQVGPQLAESLGVPHVTYVQKVEVADGAKTLVVERALEDGHMTLELPMPCLLAATRELNQPRYPHIARIVRAHRECNVKLWTATDVDADDSLCGLKGSPTRVLRLFAPQPKGAVEMIEGENPEEQVRKLVDRLKARTVAR